MGRLLATLLSRRSIYGLSLLWGAAVILAGGLVLSDFAHGELALGPDDLRADRFYHYHVSGLLSSALAFVLLLAAGLVYSRDARTVTLPEAARMVLLVELVAVAAGAGLALGVGWLKEISDALRGAFADQDDMHANLLGALAPAAFSLVVLLVTQGAVVLLGERARRSVLLLLVPRGARRDLKLAEDLVPKLRRNSQVVRQEHRTAHRLHDEILRLEAAFAAAPGDVAGELAGCQREMGAAAGRLERIEADNQALLEEMRVLRSAADKCAQSPLLCGELRELLELNIEHGAMADNVRRHLRRSARLAEEIAGRLGAAAERLPLVLLVDDDDNFRRVAAQAIRATGRAEVREAAQVSGALASMTREGRPPDLMVLDIMMPEVSGDQFAAALREGDRLAKVPVVFCSALAPGQVKGLAELRHAAYLQKPVPLGVLASTVIGLLASRETAAATTLKPPMHADERR